MKYRHLIVTTALIVAFSAALTASAATVATKNFVHDVSIANKFEIDSSKVALDHSKNDAVRKFAQQMIDDHTKAGINFTKAIEESKTDAKPETSLDQMHQNLLDHLKSESGTAFDQGYLSAQTEAHKDAVNLFTDYSRNAEEGPLKDFARDTLPTLEQHLSHVTSIKL